MTRMERLDHVNVITPNLPVMRAFYERVLGFETGWRPPFAVGGAWLYSGGRAMVHLVDSPEPRAARGTTVEHFAFYVGPGLAAFLDHLKRQAVSYSIAVVPETEVRQVNIHDPDGNHIEVQFDGAEQADLSPYEAP